MERVKNWWRDLVEGLHDRSPEPNFVPILPPPPILVPEPVPSVIPIIINPCLLIPQLCLDRPPEEFA
jgi:hypothetical protein